MKYLFFVGSFYPAQEGGPDNSVYWLVNKLTKDKKDVTVITFKKGLSKIKINDYSIQLNHINYIEDIKVIYFNYKISRLFSLAFYKWILSNMQNYEIININSFFFINSIILKLILTIKKKKYFITTRGELEKGALKYNYIKKKIYILFFKIFIKKPIFILSTSLQEKKFNKSVLGLNYRYENFKNYFFHNYNPLLEINNKKNILLYLGRLHPKKGIENLIYSLSILKKNNALNLELFIAGKGDKKYEVKLKELVTLLQLNENINFKGQLEFEEKNNLIKLSKFLILPSYSENFGLVVLESLMNSTPVIVSNFTPWKIIKRKSAGYMTDIQPVKIAETINMAFLINNEKYKQMSLNAKKVSKYYDINNNIHKFDTIIKKFYA